MVYKRQHVKKGFRPKSGKMLNQVREVMWYHHYPSDVRTIMIYTHVMSMNFKIPGSSLDNLDRM